MTRKRKCHSKSNSYVAAAEPVCLQPVLEHRQRRGRRPFHTFAPATGKARPPIVDRLQVRMSSCSVEVDLSLRQCGMSATHVNDDAKYGGAEPCSARYVSVATLKAIRSGTRISRVSSWFCTLMKALNNCIATARTRRTLTKYQIEIRSVFIPVRYVWRLIESLCNNNNNHNGSLLS